LGQNGHNPTSIIFQRLEAEKALREMEREEFRRGFARNVRAVWSERTFLFRLSGLGLAFGLLVAFLISARYTSTTRLMSPDNQSGSSLGMVAASMGASRGSEIAGGLMGLKSTSDVFVGILTTRTVQDQLIKQFDLRQVYGVRRMEDARRKLARSTDISVDRKSQIITIAVTDHDPKRAAAMGEAYIAELNRLVAELSTSSARRERIFLEERLKEVSQDLEAAEKEFSQFSSKNTAVDIKEQGKAMVDAAATVQGQYIAAQSELEGLKQIYTDNNVRVRSVKARIAELKRQLEKLGGKGEEASEASGKTADYLYPSIRKLPLLGVTYADLYRRTRVQETVYEVLTQEYELAKVQEAKEIPIVKVVDPADIPENKSFPPRLLVGISSMFLAFIGGIVFLVGSKSWHEKDPLDLSKAIAIEIWTDLKEKRLLNSVNGVSHEPETDSSTSAQRRSIIFSFLGLRNAGHNGNGFRSSSNHNSEEELSEKEN
jgi:capsule polysaccharide export protein KpsE/RkpR